MKHARILGICVVGLVCSTHGLEAEDLSRYRDFELGSNVASVSKAAGVSASDAKTLHQRPAVLQALEYRPSRWAAGATAPSTDPVEQIAFSFYNDQLFRIVVDYGQNRTEGMTTADMIEAISTVYGPRLPQTSRAPARAPTRLEIESGSPVARWSDNLRAIVLYQTPSYRGSYRLIVTDVGRDDLARAAETQARRLDDQEAPQRELARQQKERDDGRAAAAKARDVNKDVFRP